VTERDPLRDGDEALRAAFRARTEAEPTPGGCPPSDRVWLAVRGELPVDERRAVVDHTSACGACAEAWRLAVEVTPDPIVAVAPASRTVLPGRWRRQLAPLATAAVLALGLGGAFWFLRGRPSAAPEFRGEQAPVIRSLVSDDRALARVGFRLQWSAGPAGTRYDVRVTTEALAVVANGRGLAEPSFLVPAGSLRSLPAGTRLLWRVEATFPDGERVASPTFVTRLE
jgi:hypothetical protein